MHPSNGGLTSRFHEVCAWDTLLKMPTIEAMLPRPSALSKPESAWPIVVRSDWLGSKLAQVTSAPLPPPFDAFQPAGKSDVLMATPFAAAFPAAVYWRLGGAAVADTAISAAAS